MLPSNLVVGAVLPSNLVAGASTYCLLSPRDVTTCGESMGLTPEQIAARVRALQLRNNVSCCAAVAEVQTRLGGSSCQVVRASVRQLYGCN